MIRNILLLLVFISVSFPSGIRSLISILSKRELSTSRKLLQDISQLTSLEVENYVSSRLKTHGNAPVVIPIGATEQHGPNGLIGTGNIHTDLKPNFSTTILSHVTNPCVYLKIGSPP